MGFDKTGLSSYKFFLYRGKNLTTKQKTIPSLTWRLDLWKGQPESNKKLPDPTSGEDKNQTGGLRQIEKIGTGFLSPCNLYLQVGQWVSWLGRSGKV